MTEIRGLDIHFPRIAVQDAQEGIRQIQEMVRRADEHHFNFIRPFVVGTRTEAYYPSKIVPVQVYPDWDPFAVLMEEARRRGLEVHPFICVVPLQNPNAEEAEQGVPGPVIQQHPDWGMLDNEGRPTSWGNPAHPGFRGYVTSVIREIITQYEPDGISLDYARFPGTHLGYSPMNREAFEQAHGVDPADIRDDDEAMMDRWVAFRVNLITELVGEIAQTVQEVRPDTILSAYVWTDQDPKVCLRDWTEWLRRGYMDSINPTGYLYDEQVYKERCRAMKKVCQEACPGIPVFMNVGVYTSHGKLKSAEEVIRWSEITQAEGMGMSYFTWTSLEPWVDDVTSALFGERAELPWSRND